MKKKILSVLLAVCVLMTACMSVLVASADEAAGYTVKVSAAGKNVTVSVVLSGDAGAASGNFTVTYDPEKVKFVDTVSTTSAAMIAVNPDDPYVENAVRASFANAQALTEDTALWVMQFAYVGGTLSADDFAMVDFMLAAPDGNGEYLMTEETAKTPVVFTCDHSLAEWQTVQEATETEAGEKQLLCPICGTVVETQTIPVVVTDPSEPATDPTDPSEPATDPTDPSEPATDPTDPSEPATDPTDPSEPATDPTDPSEPATDPTDPSEPATDPTDPSEPATQPTEPVSGSETDTTDNSTVVSADTSTVSPDTGAHTQMAYFLLVVGAAGAVCCVVALTRKKKVQD